MPVSKTASGPSEADIRRIVPWLLYVIFFSVLNETVFNVSTPSISEQFHLLPSQVSWVVTIFILFFGIGSIVFGKLSDLFSPKHLIVIGIAVYAAGSVLGFIFHDKYVMVILFRAVQGLGASAIPAINNTIITRYFTAAGRPKMFGLVTSAFSCGVAVGPVLGGNITSRVHWAYLFLIPVFTLAAIPYFLKFLPGEERKKGKFDLLGAVLASLAVTGLMLFLTQLNPLYLLGSLAAGAWFSIHIRAHPYPFLHTALFKDPLYRIGVTTGFLMFSAIMTMMFLLPLLLSQLYALDAGTIGAVMFPGAVSAAFGGKIAGDIMVKKGAGYVTFMGLCLIALGFSLIWISVDQWVWWIAAAFAVMNLGYAFSQTSITESVSSTLRGNQIGIGMGLFSLGMFIAQALGTAVAAKLLDSSMIAFPLHPFVMGTQSLSYVNLTLLMILVILYSVFMYFLFSRRTSRTSIKGAESHGD
ncbi:MFS transporter [Paenibacillus sp. sptzw28]|uniref:MFS transporter n=1 Tax=Paenibacillus sp. sptzw28 TaxID=715179 RepID=UPI001C6EB3FE|nr:MFS transporter [Paenibacillus sp. sptzw28]QYR19678.1 MFS transporter [Paenibacillus sp. sptzw28]